MVRVILVAADGTHVEVKTDTAFSPDVLTDCCNRASELVATVTRDQAHLTTDLGQ